MLIRLQRMAVILCHVAPDSVLAMNFNLHKTRQVINNLPCLLIKNYKPNQD